MPAIAADEVIRFQNKEKSTTGPNAEPKPAQANSTSFNTLLFSSCAIQMAIAAITKTIARPNHTNSFSDAFGRINPL